MSDIKQNKYASLLSASSPARRVVTPAVTRPAGVRPNGSEVTTWDAYRNWLTKVQAPEQRRSVPDPALFSFKGYRSWAEKIRRDWETEE